MIKQDFIIGEFISPQQKNFVLNWFEETEFNFLPANTRFEEIAIIAGCFTSKGEARRNNLFGEIQPGFHKSGTKKKPIWIWKAGLDNESWKTD